MKSSRTGFLRRFGLLTGPIGVALAITAMLSLTRCEDRQVDDRSFVVSDVKGLTVDEVSTIMAQAMNYALVAAPNESVVVCIVDREGRILCEACTRVASNGNLSRLTEVTNDAVRAANQAVFTVAESRAVTASFLSSEGEAFTTQTAFFIVQENFPPGTRNEDVGPLFGVQYSSHVASDSIQCSRFDVRDDDFNATNRILRTDVNDVTDPTFQARIAAELLDANAANDNIPNGGANKAGAGLVGSFTFADVASPVDTGGIPLHRLGAHVGGIGVAGTNFNEELDIALYGAFNFMPPPEIRADRVFVDGVRFQFGRTQFSRPVSPATLTLEQLIDGGMVHLIQGPRSTLQTVNVPAFPDDFNQQLPPQAYQAARTNTVTNAQNTPEALAQGLTGRAAARLFGVNVRDTSQVVVDLIAPNNGKFIAGVLKDEIRASPNEAEDPSNIDATRDFRQVVNPLTFQDVSTILRSAAEMALSVRAGIRRPLGLSAVVHIVVCDQNGRKLGTFAMTDATVFSYDVAIQKARTCAFFTDAAVAFSARGIGWLAQPHFPPGIDRTAPGPLFQIQENYNPMGDILHPAMNGFQVFPGGLPLYKDNVLVGAVGVSGDGVDQDDQISFGGQLPPFSTPVQFRCDVVNETLVVASLNGSLQKIRNATIAAINRIQAMAPLNATQVATVQRLQGLLNVVEFRLLELQNPGRLTGVPIPWFKFARKPNLFDTGGG